MCDLRMDQIQKGTISGRTNNKTLSAISPTHVIEKNALDTIKFMIDALEMLYLSKVVTTVKFCCLQYWIPWLVRYR
jgi:hypothetical protein